MGARLWLALAVACIAALGGAAPAPATRLDAPVIAQHGDVEITATTPCGSSSCAVVTYSLDITGGTAPYQVSCNIPSGSSVALGTYAVTCTATDAANVTSASSSFSLWVLAPMLSITAPPAMTVEATTPCGATDCAFVTYSFTVTGGYPPYNLVCTPRASGSFMPVGTYLITCMAQDSKDDSTPNASFSLTVTPPSSPPVVSAGPSYTPDVTGCTVSTCMANSLSGFQIDGVTCDFPSFQWSQTSYSCGWTTSVTSPVTIHVGNQTNDVSVTFQANGGGVGVASTAATGQDSGITYTSAPIDLVDGTNTITASVDDPLAHLPAMVYTWTFTYTAPAAPSTTTTAATPTTTTTTAPTPTTTTTATPASGRSGGGAAPTAPAPVTTALIATTAPTTAAAPTGRRAAAASPSISASHAGREALAFSVSLPQAGTVTGTLVTAGGRTLLRFQTNEPAGSAVIRRALRAHVARGTRLTLRLVLRTGATTLKRTLRFRA